MSFLSIPFALFLFAAVIGFHLCPPRYRSLFLLLASYFFYIYSSPVAAIGIFVATVFTFLAAPLVQPAQPGAVEAQPSQRAMALAVTLLVLYLSLFKVLSSIAFPSALGLPATAFNGRFILPLGISYYTFKLISYIVDVYWDNVGVERNFVDFASYVVFFPQIVAGPIQRSGDFLQQIRKPSPTTEMMTRGLRRLLLGVFKKTVVADNLGVLVDLAYRAHAGAPGSALPAFYLFPIQLYADFSALTDIAIGAALLFGIQSPENFNAPFFATSISQFWRRWHMTLSNWVGDYVFMPLRMATRTWGSLGLVFSLMVNMILIGLWHNLSWTFLVFGALHGIYLSVDALTAKSRTKFFKLNPNWDRAGNWFGIILTFHLVALSFVFERSESLANAWDVLSHLFILAPGSYGRIFQTREIGYGLTALALWGLIDLIARQQRFRFQAAPVWGRWAFYYVVIGIIVKCGHNAEGFIYFKF
jgi:alginate O-acetyltransferase complex protein AlgI